MLVLSRREQERILVGEDVEVVVVRVEGRKVVLGIEAPRDVAIRRAEVPLRSAMEEPFPPPTRQLAVSGSRGFSQGEIRHERIGPGRG